MAEYMSLSIEEWFFGNDQTYRVWQFGTDGDSDEHTC